MSIIYQGWLVGLPRYEAAPRNCDERNDQQQTFTLQPVSAEPSGPEALERRLARLREIEAVRIRQLRKRY